MSVHATDRVVPTVSGAIIRAGADVRLDAHGHAWIAPPSLAVADVPALRDEVRLADGLDRFARSAAPRRAALLDVQAQGCGRDAAALARLAAKTGVAIAAVTGFHSRDAYPRSLRPWTTTDAALNTFVRELEGGFREAPMARAAAVKAAFSGEVERDDPCWEAAIEASTRTGALLVVHTDGGAGAEDLVDWLHARDLPLERVYLLDIDRRADAGLHAELADAGVLLGYADSLRPRESGGGVGAPYALLERMLEEGLARSVAVGLDLATPVLWDSEGFGPAVLITVVEARLMELGVAPRDVDSLLGAAFLERAARPEVWGGG